MYPIRAWQSHLLEHALGWMDGTLIRELHFDCDGAIACSVVTRLIARWTLPSLRNMAFEGLHFGMVVPPQVTGVTVVGRTEFEAHHLPAGLRVLKIERALRVPLDMLRAVRTTVDDITITFAPFLFAEIARRSPHTLSWKWPRFAGLKRLSITMLGPTPIVLRLETLPDAIQLLTLSTCLLETNLLPSGIQTLVLTPPGRLDVDLAERVVSRLSTGSLELGGPGTVKFVDLSCEHDPGAVKVLVKYGAHVTVLTRGPVRRRIARYNA
ncbi:hypothetical protein AURDEDRAFT_161746 [Auricularia subglabra TFB-10046 SS5]|nr:hypothetical protein AURDEDRAFT_161746 [Auricularia subglabra TFB-10046 SS5]